MPTQFYYEYKINTKSLAVKNSILKTTVLLKDINDFQKMNHIYGDIFNTNPPARTAFQVAALPNDGLVEIEVIAVK
ncbi:Rid family hydrolase [Pisciglobus halotolerans]|uniref:Rid family hydrolase n=1 Tax=Pisciglobus halotolerans TaxID=745365 RepID=UPI000B894C9C